MNELALFAGAGGGILGGHLLGWRTVCAVEWEQYPASVLCARQNDGLLPPFPIWDDVQTFDGKPWRGIVDVVSGGFPCQDISAAGKGAGIDGERSGMWGEMARIIHEVQPRYAFVENSPMLTSRGLGRVLGDLASMGFDARWGVLGAADIGAKHQRDRIWIVARQCDRFLHTEHYGLGRGEQQQEGADGKEESLADTTNTGLYKRWGFDGAGEGLRFIPRDECDGISGIGQEKETILANASSLGQSGQREHEQPVYSAQGGDRQTNYAESIGRPEFWAIEPDVGRVADGVAARVDRLKAIGNGQVPLCAATAWRILSAE